jgi:hypothetical protein
MYDVTGQQQGQPRAATLEPSKETSINSEGLPRRHARLGFVMRWSESMAWLLLKPVQGVSAMAAIADKVELLKKPTLPPLLTSLCSV